MKKSSAFDKWRLFAFLLALFLLTAACSSGGGQTEDPPPGDNDREQDDDRVPCTETSQCPSGHYCGYQGFCVPEDIPDGDSNAPAQIRILPDPVNFGEVDMEDTPEATVTVHNDGSLALHLQDANWLEPVADNPFSLVGYYQETVQPGQSYAFKIRLDTEYAGLGDTSAKLQIRNDSENAPEKTLDISAEVVLDAGTAEIGSQPSAEDGLVFDDHSLGMYPQQEQLLIGNKGDGASVVYLTAFEWESGGSQPFEAVPLTAFSQDEPAAIVAGEALTFTIHFDPDTEGSFGDNLILTYSTSDQASPRLYEIPVMGRSIRGALYMQLPQQGLNFGAVTVGESRSLDVQLVNGTSSDPITIRSIRTQDISLWNDEFKITPPEAGDPTVVQPTYGHEFTITFTPDPYEDYENGPIDFDTSLEVNTDYNNQTYYFPITASGLEGNEKPIAGIAKESHGSDILTDIEIEMGESITFYGNISKDPDNINAQLKYEWSLQKPTGSTAFLSPDPPVQSSETILFDKAGSYNVILVVEDELGARSDPKVVKIVVTSGSNTVRIELNFSDLTGLSDMDLIWIQPGGGMCNAEDAVCNLPTGQGSIMASGCGSASVCNTEQITQANALDGVYQIRAYFDESCPGTNFLDPTCRLFGEESAEFSIRIYVDGALHAQIQNERLSDEGDQKNWRIVRSSGVWGNPTPMD